MCNLANLCRMMCHEAGILIWVQILWGPALLKFGRANNVCNAAQFWATVDFSREYLSNGSRYRQAEDSVINYNPTHV